MRWPGSDAGRGILESEPAPPQPPSLLQRHDVDDTTRLVYPPQPPRIVNMAPVQLEPQISYTSVALVAGHVLAAIVVTVGVGRSLYRSYRALGPAQDTRERRAQRSTLLPIFAVLAFVSLATTSYSSLQHAILSYKTWASERDVQVPSRIYGDNGIFSSGDNATKLFLGLWVTDTPVQLDVFEILAERARRFWWGQQVELGLIPWNLFLAIEGHRRNMPLLWCYSLLGQLVSLSYAQNLFFIALVLTPSPLPPTNVGGLPGSRYIRIRDAIFPPKPSSWTPSSGLYLTTLILAYVPPLIVTTYVNTSVLKTVILAGRGLAAAPLVLPYLVPESWGTTHVNPHEAYKSYTRLFKVASAASFVLHGRTTLDGLAHSAPAAYYHRHSIHLPFDVEKRTAWERTTSAFGRILSATADHPVVSGAGFDVMLSTVSLGLWAAVRATTLQDILACTVPGFALSDLEHPGSGYSKTKSKAITSGKDSDSPTKKRGRPSKVKHENDSEASYEPTPATAASVSEGDIIPEEGDFDWESTALVWGITAVGGLGAGTAGVLGGECIAR